MPHNQFKPNNDNNNNALTKRKIKTEPFARGLRRRRVGGGVTADGCGDIVGEVKVGRLKH